jgi:MFS family permease
VIPPEGERLYYLFCLPGLAMSTTGATSGRPVSFAAPFRQAAFAVIWTATLISNVGGWMYGAASGWLMTSLNPDPFIVALVQAADTLPICLLALPAGALADIFDKRKFLIVVETLTTIVSAIYAVIVGLGWATPGNVLLSTFLVGAAGALTVPAWQSVVPQLVPKDDLPAAIAANSVGVNISRALGPALGGVTISGFGIVAPFWINAISNLGIVGALLWWREARRSKTRLPAEPFGQAVSAGLRYARFSPPLLATMLRAAGFFLFASAYWALLPLVAREQIAGGPALYGVLLGVIGASAVGGAFFLPWLKPKLGPDRLMALGALGQAVAMVLYGLARVPATAILASVVAGASLDRGGGDADCVGASRPAGLGARARACIVHDSVLRLPGDWQRNVGRGCRVRRTTHCTLSCGSRCGPSHSPDVAVETANRRGRRSHPVHALASASYRAGYRAGSRTGPGDGRIPHQSAGSRSVLIGAGESRQ